jgi:hypothetical protein
MFTDQNYGFFSVVVSLVGIVSRVAIGRSSENSSPEDNGGSQRREQRTQTECPEGSQSHREEAMEAGSFHGREIPP